MSNSLMDSSALSSEFFYIDIKEVDPANGKIWDDRGTGSDHDVAFWKVSPQYGYYALGHFVTTYHNIEPDQGRPAPVAVTLKPKSGYEYLLAEPIGFEKVWDDAGSGGTYGNCNIWRMVCPDGYVALGSMVTGDEPPNTTSVRCIKKNVSVSDGVRQLVAGAGYVNHAESGDPKAFWTDAGSGADKDVAIWLTKANGRPSTRNQVYLAPGTFVANKYHHILPSESAYALLLDFPQNDIMDNVEMGSRKVKLVGAQLPTDEEMKASVVTREYYVPFFAVQDPDYPSQLKQFLASPTYKIVRITQYEAIDSYEPINTETKQFSVRVGKKEETNYSNSIGVTLGLSIEKKAEAGQPGVASASLAVTASIETSYSHSWGGASSKYEDRSFMYPQTVTGGCFGALFQAKSTYTIYRADGTPLGSPVEVTINEFYTDEWRPEGIEPVATPTAGGGLAKTTSPNTIVFTIEAPAGKTIILEGRLEIRDGQLTSVPSIISIPSTAAQSVVPVGKSMSFDASTAPVIVNNKLSRSYTKEAWIKIVADVNKDMNIISGGDNGHHAFWLSNRNVCSGHNNAWMYVKCTDAISADWEHYAVSYDADTLEMKLYKNGKLVSSAKDVPTYAGGNFVQLGRWSDNINTFIGEMAEARIWNSARTEEQIAAQMNTAVARATGGLIAKYPMS